MTRRSPTALIAILSISATLSAADIAGSWRGTLEAGMTKLRLGLNVRRAESGALTAALDSYDQGAVVISVDSITWPATRSVSPLPGSALRTKARSAPTAARSSASLSRAV